MREIPSTLYHYTTEEGLLGILESDKLWATNIHYLNNASEYKLSVELAKELAMDYLSSLLKSAEGNSPRQKKISALLSQLTTIEDTRVCLCTFSERKDLHSQWRAYGGPTCGYSIGFKTDYIQKVANAQGFTLVECEYDEQKQGALIQTLIDNTLKKDFNTEQGSFINGTRLMIAKPIDGDFSFEIGKLAAGIRNNAFGEEKEWRLVSKQPIAPQQLQFRAGLSMLCPYYELDLGTDKSQYLSSIIVGPTAHKELSILSIQGFLAKHGALQGVPVSYSSVPYHGR